MVGVTWGLRFMLMALGLSLSVQGQRILTLPSSDLSVVIGKPCEVTILVADSGTQVLSLGALPIVPGLELLARGPVEQEFEGAAGLGTPRVSGLAWALELKPQWTGEFLVPALMVFVGTERFESQPLKLSVSADDSLRNQVSVSLVAEPDLLIPGQETDIEIRLQLTRSFLEQSLVQPFRQALDIPLQLQVPWWEGAAGLERVAGPNAEVAASPTGMSLVLNGQKARAEVVESGPGAGDQVAFRLRGRFIRGETPERLSLAVLAKLTWATRFEEDFVSGRVAIDPRSTVVAAAPLHLLNSTATEGSSQLAPAPWDPIATDNAELLSEFEGKHSAWPQTELWRATLFHFSLWSPLLLAVLSLGIGLLARALFLAGNPARRARRIRQSLKRELRRARGDRPRSLAAFHTALASWLDVPVPRLTGSSLSHDLAAKGISPQVIAKATSTINAWNAEAYAPVGFSTEVPAAEHLEVLSELMDSANGVAQ